METSGEGSRLVDLEGLKNFRDLGGYDTGDGRRVRRGRVYRSDALHRMTAADVASLRALGVSVVIDLRAPDEVQCVGVGLIDELAARYENLPTRPAVLTAPAREEVESAAEYYLAYLTDGPGCFAGIVRTLADPAGTPAVFFCNAGKDRTGVAAAMVLGLLGVDDETIARDYARTTDALEAIRTATALEYPTDVAAWRGLPADLGYARVETMLEFLGLVRERMGGWRAYVDSLGVAPAMVQAMQDALLESG